MPIRELQTIQLLTQMRYIFKKGKEKMRKITLLLVFLLIALSFGAKTSRIFGYAGTFSRTSVPNTWVSIDSARIIWYDDDGVTKIDSGYTNTRGWLNSGSSIVAQGDTYMRAYVTKTGYASQWVRFQTATWDTVGDTTVAVFKMLPSTGMSTNTLTVYVAKADGTAYEGQTVQVRIHSVPDNIQGTSGTFLITPDNSFNYSLLSDQTDAEGKAEFDIFDDALISVHIGNYYNTTTFICDTTMDLSALVFKP